MRLCRIFGLLLVLIVLTACAGGSIQERNYYLFTYYPHTETLKLRQKTPVDAAVSIETTDVARPYDRRALVVRNYGPEMRYSDVAMWAENLPDAIPKLISQRLESYNTFRDVLPSGSESANLRLETTVNHLEFFRNDDTREAQAHLDIEFTLREIDTSRVLARYANDSNSGHIDYDDYAMFVQQVNLMILQETDRFLVRYLQIQGLMKESPIDLTLPTVPGMTNLVQDTTATEQKGILDVPALSMTENEPYFRLVDPYGLEWDQEYQMGKAIPLEPGNWSIRLGSRVQGQQIEIEDVEIVPMFRTHIEPTWGCLIVDVVDEKRNYIKLQYNVFDGLTGADYGVGFSVEDEIGQQEKVWVLKPGLYKVTINDEPANTYRDFSTVMVEKGKVERLMLVVDTDEEGNPTSLIGSGVSAALAEKANAKAFRNSTAIHANVNVTSNNETNKNNPITRVTVTGQLDNRLLYDKDPYYFNSKMLLDAGLSKEEDTDFRFNDDQLSIKNTFIYYLIHELGIYTRFDVTSQLVSDRVYTTDPTNYMLIDKDEVEDTYIGYEDIKISPNFLPLDLKEGMGINLRLLNKPNLSLNLRSGFGLRQQFNDEVYVREDTETIDGISYEVYRELKNVSTNGIEFSAVSNIQFLGNLVWSTNADALVPLKSGQNTSYELENTFTVKLIKYVSLDYRYDLEYNKDVADYVTQAHKLYLRFTYMLY
jgi:ABC-type uncharacterized transport system auxiliary subunit